MINYYLLLKPGIIMGNLVTFAAGFLLASRSSYDLRLFLMALLGLSLIIASACVFNNYIDRNLDQKMARTSKRPLARGSISAQSALLFGAVLCVAGNTVLIVETNLLATALANAGFAIYVFVYSFIKTKTSLSTLIGSIAGAIPPVVGYTAVSGQVDRGALLLFMVLILWQMPHFLSIALWHIEDYSNANVPVLPISDGINKTMWHISLYISVLIPVVCLLTLYGYTGIVFSVIVSLIGLFWLYLSIRGFYTTCTTRWAKQMFRVSLVMINAISILCIFDRGV